MLLMVDVNNYKLGSTGSHIRELQKKLSEAGYEVEPDGIFGNKTKRAIEDFEEDLSVSTHRASFCVDPQTLADLLTPTLESSPLYPKGKGLFVITVSHLGDLSKLPKFLEDHGISWVAVERLRQYTNEPDRYLNGSNPKPWIEALEKAGCDLWVWGWPVPSKIDEFVETLETTREEWGASGIIADVESDFYGKEKEAKILSSKLEALGCPVGVTSYGFTKYHPRFPFSAFSNLDFGIPQIYEENETFKYPSDYPKQCIDSWKDMGYKKVIPASTIYKDQSRTRTLLEKTPVEDCIIWWSWYLANLRDGWDLIKGKSL